MNNARNRDKSEPDPYVYPAVHVLVFLVCHLLRNWMKRCLTHYFSLLVILRKYDTKQNKIYDNIFHIKISYLIKQFKIRI